MLTIRLVRRGKRKQPTYRLIVSEKRLSPRGSFLEVLGFYHPRANPPEVRLHTDRIRHWLGVGAQTSDTVWNLLVTQKVVEGAKRPKGKPARQTPAAAAERGAPPDEARPAKNAPETPAAPEPTAPAAAGAATSSQEGNSSA